MFHDSYPRLLTVPERTLVEWLLNHGTADALPHLSRLDELTVVDHCDCGCASIDFAVAGVEPADHRMTILSDYYWLDDNGYTGGVFVFTKSGQLAGLEVYSADGQSDLSQLPPIDRLFPLDCSHDG